MELATSLQIAQNPLSTMTSYPNDEVRPRFGGSGPQKSQEGWIVFVTGVHEEAQEDDLRDVFAEYGRVKSIKLNADRKTGMVKGYALVQYAEFTDAQDAINELHGSELLGKTIKVDWAFVKPTGGGGRRGGR